MNSFSSPIQEVTDSLIRPGHDERGEITPAFLTDDERENEPTLEWKAQLRKPRIPFARSLAFSLPAFSTHYPLIFTYTLSLALLYVTRLGLFDYDATPLHERERGQLVLDTQHARFRLRFPITFCP